MDLVGIVAFTVFARPIVRVSELHQLMLRGQVQQPLPFDNPLGRAVRPKSKSYEIQE